MGLVYNPFKERAFQIVNEVFSATKKIETLSYTMHKTERIGTELILQKSAIKYQKSPLKVYNKQLYPKNGIEVLYDESNPKKAIVNTNGFPWVNLTLDPEGTIMRNNQHHTIKKTGYVYFISVLEHLFQKYGEETKNMLFIDSVVWDNKKCWKIVFNNPYFKYEDYTVKKGETITDIAFRYKINEYLILRKNPKIKFYDDVKENQIITISNDYSPKLELYIEMNRKIPLLIKVFESDQVFENYEYFDIKINPKFNPEEFKTTYKDYKF